MGDQPADIRQQIRNMILKYITQENTIILAVSPANQDLATSDAIQLAKEVDPHGFRTVGVLTKLDLMDKGTDALDILNNEVIPLRLGYIPVTNRSQMDIESNKDIRTQWAAESKFFAEHPAYSAIQDRCGTQFLAQTLNRTLIHHIKGCLPEMVTKIGAFLTKSRLELGDLADLRDGHSRSQAVLDTIIGYGKRFKETMAGNDEDLPIDSLAGGAKIQKIFRVTLRQSIDDISVLTALSPVQVRNIISNTCGMSGGLFIPNEAFEIIIRRAIKQLYRPCETVVQLVHDELLNQAMSIVTPGMQRYGPLREEIRQRAKEVIQDRMSATSELVRTLIDMEGALINTSHPDFVSRSNVRELLSDSVRDDYNTALPSSSSPNRPPAPSKKPPPPARPGGNTVNDPDALMEGWLEIRKTRGGPFTSSTYHRCEHTQSGHTSSTHTSSTHTNITHTYSQGSTVFWGPIVLLCAELKRAKLTARCVCE